MSADVSEQFSAEGLDEVELIETLERAAVLAEKYGEAILQISEVLDHPAAITKIRLIIAGLDDDRPES